MRNSTKKRKQQKYFERPEKTGKPKVGRIQAWLSTVIDSFDDSTVSNLIKCVARIILAYAFAKIEQKLLENEKKRAEIRELRARAQRSLAEAKKAEAEARAIEAEAATRRSISRFDKLKDRQNVP